MTDLATIVRNVSKRPGMYMREPSFEAFAAYLNGFDVARDGGPLLGFKEWLVRRANSGNNLAWAGLVEGLISKYGAEPTDPDRIIHDAGALVLEFLAYRDEWGLRKVLGEYEEWLRKQDWYDEKLHGFRRQK
jgi:hypothetical protein